MLDSLTVQIQTATYGHTDKVLNVIGKHPGLEILSLCNQTQLDSLVVMIQDM